MALSFNEFLRKRFPDIFDDDPETKAIRIIQVLKSHNHQAVFAGGFVRDMIMNLDSHDIDIATDATPDQVESYFEKTIPVGKSFGVVRVLIDGTEFEVATFRNDGIYLDGRRPESVSFSSIEEDAKRRDFTINSLFYDPIENKILDYVGGKEDLTEGIIRFIGDPEERIAEDKLRILRGIRFAVKFGFQLEKQTFKAIQFHASEIAQVSMERIQQELVKMLEIGKPRQMIELLYESRILHYILPEIEDLKGVPQDPKWHPEGDVFEHTIRVMEGLVGKSIELQLAGWFHDVGKPMSTIINEGKISTPEHAKVGADITREILERLKFPSKTINYVSKLVCDHMKITSVLEMRKSRQKMFFAQENYEDLRALHIADKMGGSGDLSHLREIDELKAKYELESLRPVPFVTGRDLIQLGYTSGRVLGDLKTEIYERQLEGEFKDKSEAIEFAKMRL